VLKVFLELFAEVFEDLSLLIFGISIPSNHPTYPWVDNTLVDEMLAQSLDHLDLLFSRQTGDCRLDDAADRGLVDGNKAAADQ